MDNKQTIIDNNARIEAITNRLNSSTLADVRDTTATAGDVLSGKEFYGADGVKTTGTLEVSSSGGEDMLQARIDATNSAYYLFYQYQGDNVDYIANLDTSKVTNMETMFDYCSNITTIPQLNTSSCTRMAGMFRNCSKLTTIPQLDTSSVTSMASMFNGCQKLTSIPQLDTSKVNNMAQMFYSCRALTSIPQLNTSNVTSMNEIFYYCSNLTSIPELDTSKVANMSVMFRGAGVTTIPQLDTSSCTNMTQMFYTCSELTTISLLDMIKVTSADYIFGNCESLTNLTLKNIKISLQIGSGTSYGHLLTNASLLNTAKELWDNTDNALGGTRTLTMSTPSKEAIQSIYVKLVDVTDDMIANDEYISNKKPCVECQSTDDGAMTLQEYIISKNWSIA